MLILVALIVGFFIGRSYTRFNISKEFNCHDIRNFHADYLLKHYIEAFNTNQSNPDRQINQRASDLNAKLFEVCMTNPQPIKIEEKPLRNN